MATAQTMNFEIEAHQEQPTAEVIRPPPFVKLGRERVGTIERGENKTSAEDAAVDLSGLRDERKERSTAPPDRWLPKPRLTLCWFKVYLSIIIFIINIAAYAAGYAKKGEKIAEYDKELWVNAVIFLMFVSTALSFGNGIEEPEVEGRSWKSLRFLTVVVLTVLNVTIVILSSKKEREGVTPKEKEDLGGKLAILFTFSSLISTITPHVLLVKVRGDDDVEEIGEKNV